MSYLLRLKSELFRNTLRLQKNVFLCGSCPKCGRSGEEYKPIFPASHKGDTILPSRRYSSIGSTNSYLLTPLRKIKKKKLKKSTSLTEIIEVTKDSAVSETRQRLTRMKSKDVAASLSTPVSFKMLPHLPPTSSLFSASESLTLALAEQSKRGDDFLSQDSASFSELSTSNILYRESNYSPYIENISEASAFENDEGGIFFHKQSFAGTSLVIPSETDLIDNVAEIDLSVVAKELPTTVDGEPELIYPDKVSTTNKSGKKKSKGKVVKAEIKLKREERETLAKIKREEMEKMGREVSLNKSLVSYLELCVFNGNLLQAFNTLNFYRSRSKSAGHYAPVTDISAFNCVLHGYAAKGNSHKVRDVFQSILESNLKPNCQSYAAVFECMGRVPTTKQTIDAVESTILSFENQGYKLNDIFNMCIYASDQREMVLAGVRKVKPFFQPVIHPPFMGYVCPLLQSLNNDNSQHEVHSPAEGLLTIKQLQVKAHQQLKMELSGTVTVKSIEKKGNMENVAYFRKVSGETEEKWHKAILDALERNLNALSNHSGKTKNNRVINLYPFLKVLPPSDYVKIIVQEIRRLAEGSETYSPTVTQLYRELGNQVLARYQVALKHDLKILDKIKDLYNDYAIWYLNPGHPHSQKAANPRQKWQQLLFDPQSAGPHVDIPEKVWPNSVLSSIGRFLYGIIMRDIKINVNVMKIDSKSEQVVPAFYSIFRMQGVHLKEEIKPHPALVKLFQAAARDELTFETTLVPMFCPPLPWVSIHTGGYLLSAAKIVRLPFQAHQQKLRLESCPQEDLYPSLDSLNQLGAIPWKINDKVLDIVAEVFNNKGDESIGIPPPPSECPQPPHIEPNMSKQEKFKLHKQRLTLKRRKAEMYSLWCDALYRISLANHFRNDIFWLPHNMDFRGRVYPCPPHLNHLGADVARAILVFAKGQPLGVHGLDWLKIHLVNLTGLKKRDSIKDRLKYANEIMDDILDSADNPLSGRKWWAESEEPWQTLACCMEIAKALRSGDPVSYISHFPVHQDGSCNGLQHYAALGRDQAGAVSVNLAPSRVPQDVYSAVAVLVERLRQKDAENGVKVAQVLDGFIKRKVIKQTVMTTVYGVTRYGARLQIAKQLKDISGFPKEHLWPASLYLVGKTFDSLQEMFTSTKEIQDWFTECARQISQVCGQNVEWVTPLGLPVVQPYFRSSKKPVDDKLKLPEHHIFDMFERPNVMKQKNAFPPNFIHSLDSTHMMLTSLHSERSGITFVSVHDCYWTHPCSVEIMNRICREQFVSLHSQPILEDLSQYLVNKYSYKDCEILGEGSIIGITKNRLNKVLAQVPEKGTFNLNSVLDSIYFFS